MSCVIIGGVCTISLCSVTYSISLLFHFFVHSRMARNAMQLLERFDVTSDQIPELFLIFHGRIAWRFEPIQSGINSCRRGFEAGLSNGNSDMSFHCAVQVIKNSIFSGTNLRVILKEIDYYLHLLETYKCELEKNYMLIFRETVSVLIDNGQTTSIAAKPSVGDIKDSSNKMRGAVFFHKAIQCFWRGYHERCRHYSEKCLQINGQTGQFNSCMLKFYFGEKMEDVTAYVY